MVLEHDPRQYRLPELSAMSVVSVQRFSITLGDGVTQNDATDLPGFFGPRVRTELPLLDQG